MQLANLTVRLGGDMANEVLRTGVTPAEASILLQIHGNEAIPHDRIKPVCNNRRPHRVELERLAGIYGAKKVAEAFPGANPQLPATFKDIGIDVYGNFAELPEETAPVEQE